MKFALFTSSALLTRQIFRNKIKGHEDLYSSFHGPYFLGLKTHFLDNKDLDFQRLYLTNCRQKQRQIMRTLYDSWRKTTVTQTTYNSNRD